MEERLRTAEEALRLGRGIKACEEMRVRVLTQCITWSHLAASIKPAAAAAGAAAGGVRAARTSSRRHLVLPPLPDIEEAPDLLVEPTKPATPAAAAVLPKEEHKVKPSLAWLLALAPSGAAEGPITEARPPAAAHNTLIIEFDRSASLVMTLVMGGAGQDCVAMITPGVLPYTKLRPGETRVFEVREEGERTQLFWTVTGPTSVMKQLLEEAMASVEPLGATFRNTRCRLQCLEVAPADLRGQQQQAELFGDCTELWQERGGDAAEELKPQWITMEEARSMKMRSANAGPHPAK